jgi:two-component system cell cycle sensor histidine kinase/response regulator CckA
MALYVPLLSAPVNRSQVIHTIFSHRHLVKEPHNATKEVGKGTGLGLAVVYSIVQQNRGDLEVRNRSGRGTIFTVFLPQVLESLQIGQASAPLGESPTGLETVLLVEDEEIVRILIRDTLRLKGYRVLEATDTIEALQLFAEHTGTIHLLVTDVIMPGMNGQELVERLMSLHPHMQVLFISGHPGEALARHGLVKSNTAFLQKPFTPDILARKVRTVLDAAPSLPQASAREGLFYDREHTSGR